MHVYVDESGDAGFKRGQGSSDFFVVVGVVFASAEAAQRCSSAIVKLREEFGFPQHREFKFSKSRDEIKTAFLTRVAAMDWQFYSFALNKNAATMSKGYRYPASLYKNVTGMLFANMLPVLRQATAWIDKSGGREFQEQLKKYLAERMRQRDGSSPIKTIKVESSHNDNLLQMADMVCGAVARQYSQRGHAKDFWRIIRAHQRHARVWP